MGFDDRNLIQDVHMDDSLYKTGDASNLLLDTGKDHQVLYMIMLLAKT